MTKGNQTRKILLLTSFVVINAFLFLNCGGHPVHFASSATSDQKEAATQTDSNGQPYDGKIFALIDQICPDQTVVQARIILNSSTQALLVRENCQTRDPLVLTPPDFTFNPAQPNQLFYQGKKLVVEAPILTLPTLITWNYQMSGVLKPSPVRLFDIDMFNYAAADIQSLKSAGHTVVCNISAGSFEPSRPDAVLFSASDLGARLSANSPDRWLDTRSAAVRTLMLSRLEMARSKGCEMIDFDNVDAYSSSSGFPLTAATQIEYNQFLAFAAHDRNLAVALNNTPEIAPQLAHAFDFAITEQCFASGTCSQFAPFAALGKAIFAAEYTPFSASQCSVAQAASISLVFLNPALDGSRLETCP